MPGPSYLAQGEYSTYGVGSAVTADQVQRASRLIDTVCARSKFGFVYGADANGLPAYMLAAVADQQWFSAAPISPGQNVNVTISGKVFPDMIGRTVTLDVANSNVCEVCQIASVTAPNVVTLTSVQFAHTTTPVAMQSGLQIFEERYLDTRRAYSRLSLFPVAQLMSGAGVIEYGRRSDQVTGSYYDNSILAVFATANWGGAPPWLIFDVTQCGLEPGQGVIWIPVSVYLLRYTKIRMSYVGGYSSVANVPPAIKQACANIANRLSLMNGTPFVDSTIKKLAAGDTSMERFKDVAVDAETKALLLPFRANLLY